MKTDEDQVREVLGDFPFGEVRAYMAAVGWKWAITRGVPDDQALRATAVSLLWTVQRDPECPCNCATGGFTARKSSDQMLSLHFTDTRRRRGDRLRIDFLRASARGDGDAS